MVALSLPPAACEAPRTHREAPPPSMCGTPPTPALCEPPPQLRSTSDVALPPLEAPPLPCEALSTSKVWLAPELEMLPCVVCGSLSGCMARRSRSSRTRLVHLGHRCIRLQAAHALWPQRNATSRGRRMQPGHEYGRVSYLARRQAAALAQSAATPANRPTPSTANSSHVLPAPWATSVSGAGADRTLAVESDIVHAVGNEGASTAPAPASVTERKSRSSTGKPHRGHRRPSRQRAQSARGPGASHWEKLQTKYQQAGCSLHS
mmetsp:Transcript_119081/g.336815  ORF Transcript_119081/g.336815 Transcript_119081/m.336815 type:complete len:263 (+) Transcript_119081:222-1010(+)